MKKWSPITKQLRLIPLSPKNRTVTAVWGKSRAGFRYEFQTNAALGRGLIVFGERTEVLCVGPGAAPESWVGSAAGVGFREVGESRKSGIEGLGDREVEEPGKSGIEGLPEWWQVVAVEIARIVDQLQVDESAVSGGGWRVLAALIERRAGHAGLRQFTRHHNPSTAAKIVAQYPTIAPDIIKTALTDAGVAEHADIAAQAVTETTDTDQDALDVLSGTNPSLRRLDRLADLAFDAGWSTAQLEAINEERVRHATRSRRPWGDDEQFAIDTLRANGCGSSRAEDLVTAAPTFSWRNIPGDVLRRYGPQETEPVGIRFFGPPLGPVVYEYPFQQPDEFVRLIERVRAGIVAGTVSWSSDGGVSYQNEAQVNVHVDGTVTFVEDDPVPDAVIDHMEAVGAAVRLAELDGVGLLFGASALPVISTYQGLSYEYGNEPGWIDAAGEMLAVRRSGGRVSADLERRLVVSLIREPTEVSTRALLEVVGVSERFVAVLAAVDDVEGVIARLIAADQVMSTLLGWGMVPRVALEAVRSRRFRDNYSELAVNEDRMRAMLVELLELTPNPT